MLKMADIFNFDENKNNEIKKDSQLERMKELNETYNKRGEFIKKSEDKIIDASKLKEEAEKNKKYSSHRIINEDTPNSIPFMGGTQPGQGQTVNTFIPTIPTAGRNNAYSFIKPEEALEIAIKRTVESGTPINNLGFYDEINWQLNNLGFQAKNAVDIKNAIIKIIGGEITNSLK